MTTEPADPVDQALDGVRAALRRLPARWRTAIATTDPAARHPTAQRLIAAEVAVVSAGSDKAIGDALQELLAAVYRMGTVARRAWVATNFDARNLDVGEAQVFHDAVAALVAVVDAQLPRDRRRPGDAVPLPALTDSTAVDAAVRQLADAMDALPIVERSAMHHVLAGAAAGTWIPAGLRPLLGALALLAALQLPARLDGALRAVVAAARQLEPALRRAFIAAAHDGGFPASTAARHLYVAAAAVVVVVNAERRP